MKIPTDPKSPYWAGYRQALSNTKMMMLDFGLASNSEAVRSYVEDMVDYVQSTCSEKALLKAARDASPEYRRSLIKLVKS